MNWKAMMEGEMVNDQYKIFCTIYLGVNKFITDKNIKAYKIKQCFNNNCISAKEKRGTLWYGFGRHGSERGYNSYN